MTDRTYKIRYSVEEWNKKPVKGDFGKEVQPGIIVSKTEYGYTDRIIVVSIIETPGDEDSVLIMDSETGGLPTREALENLKEMIDHYLDHGHYSE